MRLDAPGFASINGTRVRHAHVPFTRPAVHGLDRSGIQVKYAIREIMFIVERALKALLGLVLDNRI